MERHLGQKIAFAFAILSYLAAVGCAYAAVTLPGGANDPVRAAFMASVVFFAGCGIVLHVIGTARLKGILNAAPQHHDATPAASDSVARNDGKSA